MSLLKKYDIYLIKNIDNYLYLDFKYIFGLSDARHFVMSPVDFSYFLYN